MSENEPPADVVRFPPLPKLPAPPSFPPDSRQERTRAILGGLNAALQDHATLAGPNFTGGFPAAAVELGRLKDAMEHGVERFDDGLVQERWDEVLEWMLRVVETWVQRLKQLKIVRQGGGIRVELQTQDDHGYYDYAFDVFPGRPAR